MCSGHGPLCSAVKRSVWSRSSSSRDPLTTVVSELGELGIVEFRDVRESMARRKAFVYVFYKVSLPYIDASCLKS